MHWKNEAPKEPGKYWWRPRPMSSSSIVTVYEQKAYGLYVLPVFDGFSHLIPVECLPGEWTDRIPEPHEKGHEHGSD